MKAAVIIVLVLSGAMALTSSARAAARGPAPADRYFGPLKYSALRVRFLTQQLKSRLERHEQLPDDISHMSVFVDDAYFEWARRYPADSWLPSSGYALARLHEELPGPAERTRALRLLNFVRSRYAHSKYARASARDLQRGVPVLPEPLWALPTPSPSPSPLAGGSPRPAVSPSVSASPRG